MPEWLQILVSRLGINLTPQTWEQVFRSFDPVERKVDDVYARIVALNRVTPIPLELVTGFNVWAQHVYTTALKLRGAAIRAGVPAASVPVPVQRRLPALRTVTRGQSALAGVAVPMYRIGQLSRPVPGTVGALGAGPLVYVAAAVIAVALVTVGVVWWSAASTSESIARVKVTEQWGRNIETQVSAFERCVAAAGSDAAAIAACAPVLSREDAAAPPAEALPRRGEGDPIVEITTAVKSILTLGVIGGVVYGVVVIVKKLRE